MAARSFRPGDSGCSNKGAQRGWERLIYCDRKKLKNRE
jgi:hypothetical protein